MSVPIAPRHLKHYKDIAKLFARHWGDRATDTESPEAANGRRTLADDLEALGPTYIKVGQMLSTRPDVLPEDVCDELTRLQDDVEPVDVDEIRTIIEDDLGARVDQLFSRFDEKPLAAASLAQVHRAAMRDGREVVVKVQRPDVEQRVADDLKSLSEVAEWLGEHTELESRYGLVSTLREVREAVLRELDYEAEARHLDRIREIMEPYPELTAPEVVRDYCSPRVLTMEYLSGVNIGRLSPLARVERDIAPLAGTIFRAYLDQALLHGFVHADPHPGNVRLLDDGRLGVLDLGQVTYVPEDLRERLLRVLLALSEGEGSSVAEIVERIGSPLRDYDRGRFRSDIAELVARESSKTVDQMEVGPILLEVAQIAGACGLRVPPQMGLLGKTLVNLEAIAESLDPSFNPAVAIRAHGPEIVGERLLDDLSPSAVFRRSLEVKRLAEDLPGRLDRITERLADGRFQVQMDLKGEERIVGALNHMANRITAGLVLSALIVGASLLMRVETSFSVLGYPGIAMIFFIVAAVGGIILLWRMTRDGPFDGSARDQ